jgi:hypothetical protein
VIRALHTGIMVIENPVSKKAREEPRARRSQEDTLADLGAEREWGRERDQGQPAEPGDTVDTQSHGRETDTRGEPAGTDAESRDKYRHS